MRGILSDEAYAALAAEFEITGLGERMRRHFVANKAVSGALTEANIAVLARLCG